MNDVTRIDCAGCPVNDDQASVPGESASTGRGRVIGGQQPSCAECVVALLLDLPSGPYGVAEQVGSAGAVSGVSGLPQWPAATAAGGRRRRSD